MLLKSATREQNIIWQLRNQQTPNPSFPIKAITVRLSLEPELHLPNRIRPNSGIHVVSDFAGRHLF